MQIGVIPQRTTISIRFLATREPQFSIALKKPLPSWGQPIAHSSVRTVMPTSIIVSTGPLSISRQARFSLSMERLVAALRALATKIPIKGQGARPIRYPKATSVNGIMSGGG